MNKKIFICLTISILISTLISSPVTSFESNIETSSDRNLNMKALIAIGLITINTQQKEIKGFVFIGYNAREIIIFKLINIEYEGMPLVVTKTLFYIFCIYKET